MAKKQILNYKFVPGAIPPEYNQYPNAVSELIENRDYLIKEVSGYLQFGAGTPGSAPTAYPNAITLLTNNKEFIKEEANAWINKQIYEDNKCERDLAYLINGVAYDVALGTNYNQIFLGLAEFNSLDVSASVVTAINNTKTSVAALPAVAADSTALSRSNAFFTEVLDIAQNGRASANTLSFPSPTNATTSQIAVKDKLINNIDFIASEVNAWVALTYPSSTHDATKCSRDIKYAIDAICYDVLYGGNSATYDQAKFFFYGFADNSPGINSTHKAQTVAAYGYLKTIISSVVQGISITKTTTGSNPNLLSQSISGNNASSADATIVQNLVQITADVVNAASQSAANAVLTAITRTTPSITWATSPIQAASNAILAAKTTIAVANAGIFYNYSYGATTQTKCKRDIGYLVDAWITDITGGGNAETIRIARTYHRNGDAQLISPTQEAAVYSFLKTLIDTYVLPKSFWPSLQSPTVAAQNTSGSAGEAGAITRFDTLIDIVIAIIPGGLASLPAISYNYNSTFVGYSYDSAKCERDTGYVIDSYIYDLKYGGNSLNYFIASRYYNNGVLQIQTPAVEVASHTFLRNLINNYILAGHLFPSYQLIETQTITGETIEENADTELTVLANNIIDVIDIGLSELPTPVLPNSQGGGLLPNTVAQIEANKRFIVEETIAYIQYNIDSNIEPYVFYTYNSDKCKRDISYVLEGYITDLKHGGNRQTVNNASKYFENGVPQVDGDRLPEVYAHTFIKTLINSYILTNIAYSARQTTVTQSINNSITPETYGETAVSNLSGIIVDVITSGLTRLPTALSNRGYIKIPAFYKLKDFLLITNTTRNTILYNFADPEVSGDLTYSEDYDSDFPAALYGVEKITTLTFDADTTNMMVTDQIQIFVEGKEQIVKLNNAASDAMERLKVGIPQSMLDADFEYGLQPTKWQAIGMMRNYPAVYEIPGSDIAVTSVVTDASAGTSGSGSSLITVTTVAPHGLTTGSVITIKALANSVTGFARAEGSFVIASSATSTTFTYYAKSKVGTSNGQVLSSTYTQLRKAGYYTGAGIGSPAFSVYSTGSSGTITTNLITQSGVDYIGFTGTVPPIGSPISGTGIVSGTQITAVTGPGGTAASTTLATNATIGDTIVTVSSTTDITPGLLFDRGDGKAVLVTQVIGNDVSLSGALTSNILGSAQTYSGVSQSTTSGSGSAASFNISRSGSNYSAAIVTGGSSYSAADTLTILGTSLGGVTSGNDATVTVTAASDRNTVATFNTGSLLGGSGYTTSSHVATTGGTGTGLYVDITALAGVVTSVIVGNPGKNYTVGDTITIVETVGKALSITYSPPTGTGYSTANNVATSGSATGTGLTVDIIDNGAGEIITIAINNPGQNYVASDVITISSGNGDATFTVASVSTEASINIASVNAGGVIQTVSVAGTPISVSSQNFVSSVTINTPTSAQIASGNTGISYSAIATIEASFPSPHGLVPGNTITTTISSSGTGAQLAAGAYYVEQVPSSTSIRYTARAAGSIDNNLTGTLYARPDSYFVHRPFDGGVQLGTGGSAHGAQAIRMSKKYIRYQSGKGVMYNTGALFAPSYDIRSLTASSTSVGAIITLVTDDTDHGCQVGAQIVVSGVATTGYNGIYNVADIIDERTLSIIAVQALGSTNAVLNSPCVMSIRQWHGSTVRSGIFDDQNGMFYQYDGIRLSVVRRSSTFQIAGTISVNSNSNSVTGSSTRFSQQLAAGDRIVIRGMSHVVTQVISDTNISIAPDYRGVSNIANVKICKTIDLIVPQEQFNIDPVNGSGPSGYTLDITKMQMIGIQHTWYGAGFIDFMLRGPEGNYIWLHRFRNSNVNTEAYMRTGNQPVRYEVCNEGAKSTLSSSMDNITTTIPITNGFYFPTAGTVIIDAELIRYTGNTGTALTGCTRNSSLTQFAGGAQRTFTAGVAASHTAGTGVILVSNTITPIISHWGSAFMIDGQFDSDRGYIFNYASTGISASTEKTTAFLIRLAPSVSNAQIGDLGEKELLNRAQLLLSSISVVSDPVSSADPFTGNTWSSGATATSGFYYNYTNAGVKNWYLATSTGTFSSTAPTFTSGNGASGTYGVNLTWAGATPNNSGGIVIEGVLNPSNYPEDPTKITWNGLSSSAAGGQPSFAQIAAGGSVTWSGNLTTSTATVQGAFTTTLTAKSFAPATQNITAVSFSATTQTLTLVNISGGSRSALTTSANTVFITDAAYDALSTTLFVGDTLSNASLGSFQSSTTISAITRSQTTYLGTSYTQITMNKVAATSSGTGVSSITCTVTSLLATTYSTAVSAGRSDFLITQSSYAASTIVNTDVLSVATYLTGGQAISGVTANYCKIGGTSYARVVMTGVANSTSTAGTGNNVTITATSSSSNTYGSAISTGRTDFLITDTQYTSSGIAVGDVLSLATYITGSQTINTITQSYITISGTPYTRIIMSAAGNSTSTSGSGNDQTVTVTAAGTAASYTRTSYLYFTSASWTSSGAAIGTKIASSYTAFPANTSVNSITTRTYGATTIYRVGFTQSSNTTIAASATPTFQFGSLYALPGEQVFSFIANPGETDTLSLEALKELTATAIGGRGTFPNGPDVLAINIYKVSGSATNSNLILRWGEAQA